MCQRRQNSVIDWLMYGWLKFSMKRKPIIRPRPMAMSL